MALAPTYEEMDEEYRDQYSQDEFTGQQQQAARTEALDKARSAVGGSNLTDEQRAYIRGQADVTHMHELSDEGRQYYTQDNEGNRVLTDMKDSDPFSGVKDLQDFDLSAYGVGAAENKAVLNRNDVAGLADKAGFSYEELDAYAKSLDEGQVGIGARRFLDEKLAALQAKPPEAVEPAPAAQELQENYVDNIVDSNNQTTTGTTTTNPGAGSGSGGGGGDQVITAPGSPTPGSGFGGGNVNANQDQDFGRTQTATGNYLGNQNTVYGNVNTGNQDFSVNLGVQNASSGGGGGSAVGALSNMQSAAAYNALNENQYQRSNQFMNPYAKARANVDMTKDSTNVAESNRASNELYGSLRDMYTAQSTNYMTNLFGDYWNKDGYDPPKWEAPAAPGSIGSNEDAEKNKGNGIKTQ